MCGQLRPRAALGDYYLRDARSDPFPVARHQRWHVKIRGRGERRDDQWIVHQARRSARNDYFTTTGASASTSLPTPMDKPEHRSVNEWIYRRIDRVRRPAAGAAQTRLAGSAAATRPALSGKPSAAIVA